MKIRIKLISIITKEIIGDDIYQSQPTLNSSIWFNNQVYYIQCLRHTQKYMIVWVKNQAEMDEEVANYPWNKDKESED